MKKSFLYRDRQLKKAIFMSFLLFVSAIAFAQEEEYYDSTPVFDAIDQRDMASLRKMVKDGMYIWGKNHEGENPLMYATRVSNEQAVAVLLPCYADTSILDERNWSDKNILEIAEAQNNSVIRSRIVNLAYKELKQPGNFDTLYKLVFSGNDSVRRGIEMGAIDVNSRSEDGESLLHYCASTYHPEDETKGLSMAQFLIRQGIDVNASRSDGDTALHIAIARSHTALASLLIDVKADLNRIGDYSETPLSLALKHKNKEIFIKLVASGANLDILDDGASVLWKSIDDEQYDFAKILIDAGADVNAKEGEGDSPLHEACAKSNLELARLLIEKGADVNSKNGSDATPPLHEAVYPENYELVKLLVDKGANANGKTKSGDNALHHLSIFVDIRLVTLLLDHGADVNAKKCDTGWTPVLLAAFNGRIDQLRLYESYGADFMAKDNDGETAIHYAVYGALQGFYELTEDLLAYLIGKKVDINTPNNKGVTALMLACTGAVDDPESAAKLLSHHAKIDLQDKDKNTAVMYAIRRPKTLQTLIDAKADLRLKNAEGKTALDIAEESALIRYWNVKGSDSARILRAALGNETPLKTLNEAILLGYKDQIPAILAQTQDIDKKDDKGRTAVYCAVAKRDLETLKILVNRGANVNIEHRKWLTPLCLALIYKDNEMVKLLIASGADVNKASYDGDNTETPLRKAMGDYRRTPNPEAVKLLIQAGAKTEWKDEYGITELMYACRKSSPEIVQYLLDHGASIFYRTKGNTTVMLSVLSDASEENKIIIRSKVDSLFVEKTLQAVDNINLRTEPNTGSEKLITLAKGSQVRILQTGDFDEYDNIPSCWVKVSTVKGAKDKNGNHVEAGTEGWLFAGYLK